MGRARGPLRVSSRVLGGEIGQQSVAGEFKQRAIGTRQNLHHRIEIVVEVPGQRLDAGVPLTCQAFGERRETAHVRKQETAFQDLGGHAAWHGVALEPLDEGRRQVGGEQVEK
ncbi:MAG: hypothetical protein BWY25_02689 [Chloroflexi bacterium ADurb.Bin222]|nr:MAG: hypothetical protein BWY25_02689 [Chloroflexi bacterium ADurb.Bin222]